MKHPRCHLDADHYLYFVCCDRTGRAAADNAGNSIPGLVPFATAGLIVPMLISYFRSPKRDTFLLVIFIVAMVLNLAGGILQIIANG